MINNKQWGFILFGLLALGVLVHLLGPVLQPFLTALLLAYLFDPWVEGLSHSHVPRVLATTIVFLLGMGLAIALILLLIPLLQAQWQLLPTKLPLILTWMQDTAIPKASRYLGITVPLDLKDTLKDLLTAHWQQAGSAAKLLWIALARSGSTVFLIVTHLLLILVVTFYLLRDWPRVLANIQGWIPSRMEATILRLAKESDSVLSGFFRGQLLVMLALGGIYSTGLWLSGLDLALLIGLISGVVSIVPYLGFIIGIVSASIAALIQYHQFSALIGVCLAYGVGQLCESMILTPLLVGDRIGLHPVAVIFSIMAGGQLFGFVGVLLALPVAAVLRVVLSYLKAQYAVAKDFSWNN